MQNPDFWDFMLEGGYDLLFHNDEDGKDKFRCPHCGTVLTEDDDIECVDEKKKIFKCPDCGKEIKIHG